MWARCRIPTGWCRRRRPPARIRRMPDALPIACSLDGDGARRRWHEWSAMIARRRRTERSSRRLAVYFAAEDDSWAKLSELVAAEGLCCGFVTWELKDLGAELMLAVGGDPEGVKAMAESFGILGDR